MTEYIYERPDEPAKVVRDGWSVRIEWDFEQRERVTRCFNCRHSDMNGWNCHRWMTLDPFGNPMPACAHPCGFCAWGERRDA